VPSKFFPPPGTKMPDHSVIDLTKSYDIYRSEHGSKTVVHRNVLIRGVRSLFGSGGFGRSSIDELLELQQPNGQIVFIARFGIVTICEHGTDVSANPFGVLSRAGRAPLDRDRG
jgi:hypothetical protein